MRWLGTDDRLSHSVSSARAAVSSCQLRVRNSFLGTRSFALHPRVPPFGRLLRL